MPGTGCAADFFRPDAGAGHRPQCAGKSAGWQDHRPAALCHEPRPGRAGGFPQSSSAGGAALSGCRAGHCHAEPWGRFHLCYLWLSAVPSGSRGLSHRHGGGGAKLLCGGGAAECAADRRHGCTAHHCAGQLGGPRAGNARHQSIDEDRQAIACLVGYPAAGR